MRHTMLSVVNVAFSKFSPRRRGSANDIGSGNVKRDLDSGAFPERFNNINETR